MVWNVVESIPLFQYIKRSDTIALSVGKRFEDNWKKSVPNDVYFYRPPDPAHAFSPKASGLRFSIKPICDFIMFDGEFLIHQELKTVKGNSISFERTKEENGVIHYHQIENLREVAKYKNVYGGFVIDFRGTDNTYYLPIGQFDRLISKIDKKSFNEKDMINNCLFLPIAKEKLQVNYRYDIVKYLEDLRKLNKILEEK